MELKGAIEKIFETQTYGANGFRKREFVINTQEQYPQQIKFEMTQDRCALLDSYKPGDTVAVQFDVKGREYNGKYFVNLQSWKIQKEEAVGNSIVDDEVYQETAPDLGSVEDDLPF